MPGILNPTTSKIGFPGPLYFQNGLFHPLGGIGGWFWPTWRTAWQSWPPWPLAVSQAHLSSGVWAQILSPRPESPPFLSLSLTLSLHLPRDSSVSPPTPAKRVAR